MLFMQLLAGIDLTHFSLPLATLLVPMAGTPDPFTSISTLATAVNKSVQILGGTVFVVAVSIAGIMRMVAFGNERRIALSNMALTAAVVGLVIMLLGTFLGGFITNILPH